MAKEGIDKLRAVDATGMTVGIVAGRWYGEITDQMLDRAVEAAKACNVSSVEVHRVAGCMEIPVVAQALASQHDAVVALGVVIRGKTAHFDYVCRSVTDGLTRVSLDERTAVGQGIATVDNAAQALDRAGHSGSSEDKGWESTIAALDSALTLRSLAPSSYRGFAPARRRRAWGGRGVRLIEGLRSTI